MKVAVLIAVLVYLAMDTALGWLIPVTLIGGALIAATRFAAKHQSSLASPDSFGRAGMSADVMNLSRVRVAGVGGIGLMFVAGVVALQYPLSTLVLVAGAVGGAIAGIALILYRRDKTAARG